MKRNRISEATGSGSAGNFKVPIVLSPQPWTEDQVAPFTNPVYSYNNAELAYEEADGDFKETPEERARIEKRTDRIAQVDKYLKSFDGKLFSIPGKFVGRGLTKAKAFKHASCKTSSFTKPK